MIASGVLGTGAKGFCEGGFCRTKILSPQGFNLFSNCGLLSDIDQS